MSAHCKTAYLVLLAATAAAFAQNTGARLFDGPAVLDYTAGGAAILPTVPQGTTGNVSMNFQLGGVPGDPAERQVAVGNWFYRIGGDTRERHFANAGTRTIIGTSRAEWTFPQIFAGGAAPAPVSGLTGKMAYEVFSTGVDSAYFSTEACIYNNSLTTYSVDLFFAVDLDLAATNLGDDFAPLSVTGAGRTWTATDGLWTGVVFGPGATGAGVDTFATLLGSGPAGQLTDSLVNNYPDVNGATGLPGLADNSAVLQWSLVLPPGSSYCMPAYVGVGRNGVFPITPEPASLALLGLGGGWALRLRRRRR